MRGCIRPRVRRFWKALARAANACYSGIVSRAFRALILAALASPVSAGQIEAPVAGEFSPGARTGAVGSSLGAPTPIQMTVPSLAGAVAPGPAPALAPVPVLAPPAAVQALTPKSPAVQPAAAVVPVLPSSGKIKPAASAPGPSAEPGEDAGRVLFDRGPGKVLDPDLPPVDVVDRFAKRPIDFRSPRSVVRRGASRGEGWEVDGVPARRLSGGSFKEVLIHPADPNLVIKLFSEIGAKDAAGSLSEKRRELRNLEPLLALGRAPRVVEQGALELETPSSRGRKTTGYIVSERVVGRELGDLLGDPDPAVRARALKEARALFDDLIAARIKLEDGVKMHENIAVGRAAERGPLKAWVLDAGEATRVAERGALDRLFGRPDPLRAYYDAVLAGLSRRARI